MDIIEQAVDTAVELREQIADLSAQLKTIEQTMRDVLDSSGQDKARFNGTNGHYINVSKTRDSKVFDSASFEEHHPDLYSQFKTKIRHGGIRVTYGVDE